MLEDSGATVLITQGRLRTRLPEYPGAIVCLDRDRSGHPIRKPTECSPARPLRRSRIHHLYGSGSDRQPEGGRGDAPRVHEPVPMDVASVPFAAAEICAQRTSLSFVDSIWEIFGPLCRGAALHHSGTRASRLRRNSYGALPGTVLRGSDGSVPIRVRTGILSRYTDPPA